MNTWVIYEHPLDYPNRCVVRRWNLTEPGPVEFIGETVEEVREQLLAARPDLIKLSTDERDDPVIAEVWL
jgi:hypothetical protein